MNTTLGLTCSATVAKASLSSVSVRVAEVDGACTGVMTEEEAVSWAVDRLGRSSRPANKSPSAKARITSPPNLSQFKVRTDIVVSQRGSAFNLVYVGCAVGGLRRIPLRIPKTNSR